MAVTIQRLEDGCRAPCHHRGHHEEREDERDDLILVHSRRLRPRKYQCHDRWPASVSTTPCLAVSVEPGVDDDVCDTRAVAFHSPFLEHCEVAAGRIGGPLEASKRAVPEP